MRCGISRLRGGVSLGYREAVIGGGAEEREVEEGRRTGGGGRGGDEFFALCGRHNGAPQRGGTGGKSCAVIQVATRTAMSELQPRRWCYRDAVPIHGFKGNVSYFRKKSIL